MLTDKLDEVDAMHNKIREAICDNDCVCVHARVYQVILYSMMLRDRYQMSEHPGGLLAYLKAKHVQGIPAFIHEQNGEPDRREGMTGSISHPLLKVECGVNTLPPIQAGALVPFSFSTQCRLGVF